MKREILVQLRTVLADLYPEEASIRRIMADAGLDPARVDLTTTALNQWHNILTEAEKIGEVAAVLEVAEEEYGSNAALRTACDHYRQSADPPSGQKPTKRRTTKSADTTFHNEFINSQVGEVINIDTVQGGLTINKK